MMKKYSIESIMAQIGNIPENYEGSVENYIRDHTDRSIPDDPSLQQSIAANLNSSQALIEGAEARSARRSLSTDAWFQMIVQAAELKTIERPEGLSRPIENMLNPLNPENNNALLQAVKDKKFAEQARLYGVYLEGLPKYNADELLDLSDEALVKDFYNMYQLFRTAQGAGEILDPKRADEIYAYLSDESREQVKKLSEDLPVFSALMARFEMICNPYYEKVDIAKLTKDGAITAKAAAGRAPEGSAEAGFFEQLRTLSVHNERLTNWRITRQLREDGFDLSSLKIVDLDRQEYSLNPAKGLQLKDALKQGKPLLFHDGEGNLKALRPDGGKFVETNARYLLENALHATMNQQVNELVALATGKVADPGWLMTGSSQYRALKSAMQAHAKFVKTVSRPPERDELEGLNASLESLKKASKEYLQHKDPSITDDMTFERYMELKGGELNKREAVRLRAAFIARDLEGRTLNAVALNLQMGIKNTKTLTVDKAFYQGLLRKGDALQKKLEEYMMVSEKGAERAEQINTLLADEKINESETNPYPDDEIATLLWETRQMTELIERTEAAMGLRMQDRAIDPKEKAKAEAIRRFGGKDPVSYSVEALRAQLTAQFENAGKEQVQNKGPRKPDYSPKEFVISRRLIDDKVISHTNSTKVLNDFLNSDKVKNEPLRSDEKALLDHRIRSLTRIEELEKKNPSRPPLSGYTVERDGKPVLGEPRRGDKIMLPGVHERRSQNTMNGCWSVSLCSQLEYRGIDLSQEDIRSYRPDNDEAQATGSSEIEQFYRNKKQVMSEYTGLVSRMLPNSVMVRMQLDWTGASPERVEVEKEYFRDAVFHALTKDNSPLSICAGGHYLTIVGMKGDKFYVKNPMHLPGGNPEAIETWTLDDFMKKAKDAMEVYWTADVTPSLGGSVEPLDRKWFSDGIFYGNGQAYSTTRNDFVSPLMETEKSISGSVTWGNTNREVTVFQSRNMKYNRLPGGCYNADALDAMEKELVAFYNPGLGGKKPRIPSGVGAVMLEMAELRDKTNDRNPHDKMLDLAEKYLEALNEVREARKTNPSNEMQNLEKTLSRQLNQVHRAVFDAMEADYKNRVGSSQDIIVNGNLEECPQSMNKREYQNNRNNFVSMQEGLSGMVYFHQIKSYGPENQDWIKYMRPDAATKGIAAIKNSEAFRNMMEEIHDDAKFGAETYVARKEFLSRQAGNKHNVVGKKLEAKIKEFKETLTQEEARQKLEELEKEATKRLVKAGFTAEEVAKGPKNGMVESMKFASRMRIVARRGKTDVVFNRYMEHLGKVLKKNDDVKTNEIESVKQKDKEAAANDQVRMSAQVRNI